MKSYIANTPKEALRMALNDPLMGWSKHERAALEKIVSNEDNFGVPYGTGRNWTATKRSRIIFHTHESACGYNVGRW